MDSMGSEKAMQSEIVSAQERFKLGISESWGKARGSNNRCDYGDSKLGTLEARNASHPLQCGTNPPYETPSLHRQEAKGRG